MRCGRCAGFEATLVELAPAVDGAADDARQPRSSQRRRCTTPSAAPAAGTRRSTGFAGCAQAGLRVRGGRPAAAGRKRGARPAPVTDRLFDRSAAARGTIPPVWSCSRRWMPPPTCRKSARDAGTSSAFRPQSLMCASSRMVVHRKGSRSGRRRRLHPASRTTRSFSLGPTLGEARRTVPLNHPHCARFCVLGGASCSA